MTMDYLTAMKFSYIFSLFIIYSFCGWIAETIYCSLLQGKFVYRGFLNGPICPIYGFGALMVIYLLQPFHKSNLLVLFIASFLVTSILEYGTSFVMERIFDMKWWDYSTKFMNINGRVCLRNSTMFGLLSLFLVKFAHPGITKLLESLPRNLVLIFTVVTLALILIDFMLTVSSLLDLKDRLASVENYLKELEATIENKLGTQKLKARFENFKLGFSNRRILKAYPNIGSKKNPRAIGFIKENLQKLRPGK